MLIEHTDRFILSGEKQVKKYIGHDLRAGNMLSCRPQTETGTSAPTTLAMYSVTEVRLVTSCS